GVPRHRRRVGHGALAEFRPAPGPADAVAPTRHETADRQFPPGGELALADGAGPATAALGPAEPENPERLALSIRRLRAALRAETAAAGRPAAKTGGGESVSRDPAVRRLSSLAAHALWAETYDRSPNPLLALEERLLPPLLPDLRGLTALDAACGAGRWLGRLRN